MTWNYRICKETRKWDINEQKGETVEYSIREAYYNKQGEVQLVSQEPKAIVTDICEFTCANEAECITSIKSQLEMMTLALSAPVLDIDNIVFAELDGETDEDDEEDEESWAQLYADGCVE